MNNPFETSRGMRRPPLIIAAMVVGGVALAAVLALFFGWIVMLLWNWLMPDLFSLPRIGYWQAWGLVLLSHILIKPGIGGHGHGDHPKRSGRSRSGAEDWKEELRRNFDCGEAETEEERHRPGESGGPDDAKSGSDS